MLPLLLKLTENDKRVLIALGILFILIFIIAGYIGLLVERIMKYQAKRVGQMMHDVVQAKVVKTERLFKKLAKRKSNQIFFRQALVPMMILFFALIIYIINSSITHEWLTPLWEFNNGTPNQGGRGVCTLFFLWDFNDPSIYVNFFGLKIIGNWPPLINTPHFSGEAWASYIIFLCLIVGGIWYLVAVQAHIARRFRINKLAKKIYHPTLDLLDENNNNNNQNTTQTTNG